MSLALQGSGSKQRMKTPTVPLRFHCGCMQFWNEQVAHKIINRFLIHGAIEKKKHE